MNQRSNTRISIPFNVSVRIKTNYITGQEVSEMLAKAMRLSAHVRRGSLHRANPKFCYVLSTVSSTSLFDSVEAVVGHFAKKSREPSWSSSPQSSHHQISEIERLKRVRGGCLNQKGQVSNQCLDLTQILAANPIRDGSRVFRKDTPTETSYTQTKLIYSSCRAPSLLSSSPSPTVARFVLFLSHLFIAI